MTTFALLDVNNFYCSVETVFNPVLKDKAAIVLSNNDGNAVSRNALTKSLGIQMGEPWFKIQQRFKPGEVIALSSNYAVYADMGVRKDSFAKGQ